MSDVPAADDVEQEPRIAQMTVTIEKLRTDMKWETRKFLVSAALAGAALIGAGIALGNYVSTRPPPPPPPPQVIILEQRPATP